MSSAVQLLCVFLAIFVYVTKHGHSQVIAREQEKNCSLGPWKNLAHQKLIIHFWQRECRASVLQCYCLSPTKQNLYALGRCFEGCFLPSKYNQYYNVSITQENNGSICSEYNRIGPLCGECSPGFGHPVYSFTLHCVKCPTKNLWKHILFYILIAYVPLTVFLVIILVFTVNSTSAPLRGWILMCQLTSNVYSMRVFMGMAERKHLPPLLFKFLATAYGIWNLDFFRSVYTPFCLHPRLTGLEVISLDILIAVYPPIVIMILYVLIKLYSRGNKLLVLVWWPIHKQFLRFRQQLNVQTSLVDAFGTLFDLSFVKLFCVLMELMQWSWVWEEGKEPQLHVYFKGGTVYFEKNHLPFALLSILLFVGFYILPIVLILVYSFPKCKCVHWVPRFIHLSIYPFMDNILSCFKDGTNGTANCRYFAVIYHLLRLAALSTVIWTKSQLSYPYAAMVIIVGLLLVALIRPYKSTRYNLLDIFFLGCLAFGMVGSAAFIIGHIEDPKNEAVAVVVIGFAFFIPLLYGAFCVLQKMWSLRKCIWRPLATTYRRIRDGDKLLLN